MRRVRLHEAASQEAIEAAAWYDSKRAGLGTEFDHAVQSALDLLEQDVTPATSLPIAFRASGARRLVLRRFPYDVVFVERDTEIVVVAFSHHARRPGYWRNRMQGIR